MVGGTAALANGAISEGGVIGWDREAWQASLEAWAFKIRQMKWHCQLGLPPVPKL